MGLRTVQKWPTLREVAEPAYPRGASKRARLFLGGTHLRVHVEPALKRFEVGRVRLDEAHVAVLLDSFEEHGGDFGFLQLLVRAVGGHKGRDELIPVRPVPP